MYILLLKLRNFKNTCQFTPKYFFFFCIIDFALVYNVMTFFPPKFSHILITICIVTFIYFLMPCYFSL